MRRSKVCDFGLARKQAENTMTGQCGTFQWMAPEVIGSNHYTEKADVFSFGIIMWELVSRQLPYQGMNSAQVSVGVLTKGLRPSIPDRPPPPYAELIEECWHQDPDKRPSLLEILERLKKIRSLMKNLKLYKQDSAVDSMPYPWISISPVSTLAVTSSGIPSSSSGATVVVVGSGTTDSSSVHTVVVPGTEKPGYKQYKDR